MLAYMFKNVIKRAVIYTKLQADKLDGRNFGLKMENLRR